MQLENSHKGYAGKSLVNFIQDSLDQAIIDFDEAKVIYNIDEVGDHKYNQLQGYVAGIAKALGILRGTSVKTEITEARQRLVEREKSNVELIGEI